MQWLQTRLLYKVAQLTYLLFYLRGAVGGGGADERLKREASAIMQESIIDLLG